MNESARDILTSGDYPAASNSVKFLLTKGISIPSEVILAYEEENRHYHDLSHIDYILDRLPLFRLEYSLSDDEVVMLHLIAWYHDVVYVAGDSDNEVNSAYGFRSLVSAGLMGWMTVSQAILDTKTHTKPSSWISAIFMDLDLSGLGSTLDTYAANGDNVRKEFSHVSDEEWSKGRLAWVNSVLDGPIYHTSLASDMWRENAEHNLIWEQSLLESEVELEQPASNELVIKVSLDTSEIDASLARIKNEIAQVQESADNLTISDTPEGSGGHNAEAEAPYLSLTELKRLKSIEWRAESAFSLLDGCDFG